MRGASVAYTAKVFPRPVSFYTGWMMMLAYFIVCPWEAVAVGRIAGYIFPALDRLELYRVAGNPVYLPHLVTGLALTAFVTFVNYRGVRLSASFQNWTTFGTLALFLVFVAAGVARGSPVNFPPLFTHTPFLSILLVLQIVPYFMTGFESVTKAAEEANPQFRAQGFARAIFAAIAVGGLFYIVVIAAVAFVAPWHTLTNTPFMTAVAFEHAVGARWIVSIILSAALLSLFKVFNGNFVAASRLLFAMGRRGLIDTRVAAVHPRNRTPAAAVACMGMATGLCMFLGSAILVPITEVGSVACATGWFAVCASYLAMRPPFVAHYRRARRVGGPSHGADEADPGCARQFFGERVACARSLDYPWHRDRPGLDAQDRSRKTLMIKARLLALLLLLTVSTAFAADAPFDLVITNGHIVDGTGSPWYSGDVGTVTAASPTSGICRRPNASARSTPKARSSLRDSSTCWANRKPRFWSIRVCPPRSIRGLRRKSPAKADRPLR